MSQQSGAGVVELSNAESLFVLRATAPGARDTMARRGRRAQAVVRGGADGRLRRALCLTTDGSNVSFISRWRRRWSEAQLIGTRR